MVMPAEENARSLETEDHEQGRPRLDNGVHSTSINSWLTVAERLNIKKENTNTPPLDYRLAIW
jgi:hypothetical protein